MLPILQCEKCFYGNTLNWTNENLPLEGVFTCKEYPDEIPKEVNDGTGDCPEFVPKKVDNV